MTPLRATGSGAERTDPDGVWKWQVVTKRPDGRTYEHGARDEQEACDYAALERRDHPANSVHLERRWVGAWERVDGDG